MFNLKKRFSPDATKTLRDEYIDLLTRWPDRLRAEEIVRARVLAQSIGDGADPDVDASSVPKVLARAKELAAYDHGKQLDATAKKQAAMGASLRRGAAIRAKADQEASELERAAAAEYAAAFDATLSQLNINWYRRETTSRFLSDLAADAGMPGAFYGNKPPHYDPRRDRGFLMSDEGKEYANGAPAKWDEFQDGHHATTRSTRMGPPLPEGNPIPAADTVRHLDA